MDNTDSVEQYAFKIASILHKTNKGIISMDKVISLTKEMVKEDELIDLVANEVLNILLEKYQIEIIDNNINLNIRI